MVEILSGYGGASDDNFDDISGVVDDYGIDLDPDLFGNHHDAHDVSDNEIRFRMVHTTELISGLNVSFGQYMRTFDPLYPDLFVLTANSAIPVADSIRGWYDVAGRPAPEMTYIDANRQLAYPDIRDSYKWEALPLDEINRRIVKQWHRFYDEHQGKTAAVIDQYVDKGGTLRLASSILDAAGLTVVGQTDRAKWYNNAYNSAIDLDKMTSRHAEFMRSIGRRAAYCSDDDFLAE